MENTDLCKKLFEAFSSGDADGVRQLCVATGLIAALS